MATLTVFPNKHIIWVKKKKSSSGIELMTYQTPCGCSFYCANFLFNFDSLIINKTRARLRKNTYDYVGSSVTALGVPRWMFSKRSGFPVLISAFFPIYPE